MSITTQTAEPVTLRAGDTWQWRRDDLGDYPAPDWALTYYFRNATAKFDLTAAADGTAHLVNVAMAATGKAPGKYDWIAVVKSATDRHQVGNGIVEVLPDLAADVVYDARTFARKMLDAIEAALLGQASASQISILTAEFNGRKMTYNHAGLLELRAKFRAEVAAEANALRVKQGKATRNHVLVRFT